ncbi:beta-1,4-galactosyltransferase galt-1-like [Argonauta hians]
MQRDVFLLSVVILHSVVLIILHSHIKGLNKPLTEKTAAAGGAGENNPFATELVIKSMVHIEQALEQQVKSLPLPKNLLRQPPNTKSKHGYSAAHNVSVIQSANGNLKTNSDLKLNCSKCKKAAHTGSFQDVSGIFVLTAFYDKRIPSRHQIRIIALRGIKDKRMLACWFKNGTYLVKSLTTKYEMCENHGGKFGGWIYSCMVPTGIPLIEVVYLSINTQNILAPLTKMNLITLNKTGAKKMFGVCIPPLFGSVGMTQLVQFLELNRILGASHFHFYLHNTSSSARLILNHYVKINLATIFEWELPSVTNNKIWYHGQLLAIQDCLYRNMANFQFLLFSDLDEFVIPRKTYTWPRLVNYMKDLNKNRTENNLGYSFKSAFFDPLQTPDPSQQFSYLQRLHRSKSVSKIRTKVMVQPDKVFELGIHHVSKPIFENLTVTHISPDIAMIHHYRKCERRFEPKMRCEPKFRDATILKYTKQLHINYNQRIKELFKDLSGV